MSEWHVDDRAIRDWVDRSDTLIHSTSVEQHLLSCATCRGRVRVAARSAGQSPAGGPGFTSGRPDPEAVWSRVRDAIELPRPSVLERLLRRLGLPADDARLVSTAWAFRSAWAGALLFALAFAGLAAAIDTSRGQWLFLALAPVLPCLGVAVSYEPGLEPALEQDLATPYPAVRLVLLRTVAVLAFALPIVLLFGVLVPIGSPYLWLLPSVGFVAAVLAASTWWSPLRAAIAITTGWTLLTWQAGAHGRTVGDLLQPRLQVVYLALTVLSGVIVIVRAGHLRELRPRGGWL
jgi:hypothetical protein